MFRIPRLTALPRASRRMHTDGRQIDHNGPSTPLPHHHPPPDPSILPKYHVDTVTVQPTAPQVNTVLQRFTKKGKPMFNRPARTVPVTLPNGDLEPPKYPPPEEYFQTLEEKRSDPHPLWQFFHLPVGVQGSVKSDSVYPQDFGSLETLSAGDGNLHSGRAWTAAELRQKSFRDLHTLWYILLRERNVLVTQGEERRRLGVGSRVDGILHAKRAFRCRKSMARIKYVLNERRLGLIAAAGPQLAYTPEGSEDLKPIPMAHIPWSSSNTSDPAGATAAIRGVPPNSKRVNQFLRAQDSSPAKEESFVEDEEVAKEEVEARDEGFGGGKEAEHFTKEVNVIDGKVEKV
nr:hypothetical protein L203_01009 [Cryptococcus depauperatus CBS 7841]